MKTASGKGLAFFRRHVVLTAFAVCFLIASAVFVPKIVLNHGLFAFSNDFSAEEIPYGMLMNEGVKSGALWNGSVDIGSNLLESFNFYGIGSPFFLFSLLFPAKAFPYLIGWLLILKFAVAGATAALFLKRYLRTPLGTVFGAVLYAFSGFQVISVVFYHFQDVVALFPLMLWGLDTLMLDGKRHRFALACLVNALTNPVFFFADACFTVLYYIARYLIPSIKEKCFKLQLRRFFGCLLEAAVGSFSAAVLLVPAVAGLAGNARASALMSLSDGLIPTKFMIMLRLQAFFLPPENMNAYSAVFEKAWGTWNAFLPLCGSCFAIAYAITEKDWLGRKLLVLVPFIAIPLLGSVFFAFTAEEYGRWYYMLTLLMALASAKVFEKPERYSVGTGCLVSAAVIAAYFGATAILGRHLNDGAGLIFRPARYFGSIAAALAMLVLCFGFKKFSGKRCMKRVFAGLTALVCVAVLGVEAYVYSGPVEDDSGIGFTSFGRGFSEAEVSYVTEVSAKLEREVLPYRYRFDEGIGHTYYNFAMTNALPSTGSFISTVSGKINAFYSAIGEERRAWSFPSPAGISELLGARYTVTRWRQKGAEPEAEYVNANGQTFYVYFNEKALPLGTLYDSYITAAEFATVKPAYRAAVMLKTLVVADDAVSSVQKILTHEDGYPDIRPEMIPELSASHPKDTTSDFVTGKDAFSCTVSAERPSYAFFAVPAEKYWHVTVNGAETKFIEVNGLMAIPVEAGENVLAFTYRYTPFRLGTVISAAAFLLWAGYALLSKKRVCMPFETLPETET